jgi:TonB-linked SusC/RagA family outer membrane protein
MEVSGGQNEYAIEGFFGRLNYDYKEKYLFEVSGRYDGSSRFAADHRWGFFPSASAGWRISEEEFFAPLKTTVNNFKIRYSYGALGNQQVGYYDYIRKVAIDTGSYLFGTGANPTIATIGAPVASNLTWEKTLQHDLGLDLALLGNRLTFTADAYIRDTKDMLTAGKTLPAVYGASSPKMNAADLRTKGYELQLVWRDGFSLAGKPFNYSVTASFSDYLTKITKFDNPNKSLAQSYYEGMTWGEIWGYYTDGLFKDDAEAAAYPIDQKYVNNAINGSAGSERGIRGGDLKFRDLDGDNKIGIGENTVDKPGDRRIIGNSQPRYNYGLNLAFQWMGFDFSIFFQGIGKLDWAPATNNVLFWGPYARPYATLIPKDFHKMIWSEDNPDAYYPRPRGYVALGSNRELTVPTDRYLQNIAYCRLKNLNVGYTLPKNLTDRVGIENIRIYFSGENLAKWSGIHSDYIDPEMAKLDSTNRIYPWQKSFMFGIDLTF